MTTLAELQASRPVNRERVEEIERHMIAQTRGYRLRERREIFCLTGAELAVRIGATPEDVARIEDGEVETLSIELLRRYVEFIGGELRIECDLGDARYRLA